MAEPPAAQLERVGPDKLRGYLVIRYSQRAETVEELFTWRRYEPF